MNINSKDQWFLSFCIFVLLIVGFFIGVIMSDTFNGEPASIADLKVGNTYEVVSIYDQYFIIKDDEGRLKFIGPVEVGTNTFSLGEYVKTKKGGLRMIK